MGAEIIEDAQELFDPRGVIAELGLDRRDAAEAGAVVGDTFAAIEAGRHQRTDIDRRLTRFASKRVRISTFSWIS